jgi:SPP1 family predicted phage head-tail adaptor
MIPAGELNRIISIQSNSPTTFTAEGEPVSSWVTVIASVWAKYEPLTGREFFLASQRYSGNIVRFIIRYTPAAVFTPPMRIVFEGDYYDIKSIKDIDGERTNLEILSEQII